MQNDIQSRNIILEWYFRVLVIHVRETGQVQPDKNKNKEIERPERNYWAPEVLAAVQINPHYYTRRLFIDSAIPT